MLKNLSDDDRFELQRILGFPLPGSADELELKREAAAAWTRNRDSGHAAARRWNARRRALRNAGESAN